MTLAAIVLWAFLALLIGWLGVILWMTADQIAEAMESRAARRAERPEPRR